MKTLSLSLTLIVLVFLHGCSDVKVEIPEMTGEWTSIGQSGLSEIRCIFPAGDKLFAGGVARKDQNGLVFFDTTGSMWTPVTELISENQNVSWIAENEGEFWISVFANSEQKGSVWYSRDASETWVQATELPNQADPRCIIFAGSNEKNVIIGTVNDGLFLSGMDEHAWQTPVIPPDDSGIQSLAINSGNPDHLIVGTRTGVCESQDGGLNWIPITPRISEQSFFVVEVAAHPLRTDCFTCIFRTETGAASVSITTDGAKTWKIIRSGFYPDSQPRCIAFHPSDPNVIFSGTVIDGVYRSDSLGELWYPINNGLPLKDQVFIVHSLAVTGGTNPVLYAGSNINGSAYQLTLE